MNSYANTYKSQQIQTASQEQILIMLYEGAIRFLNTAKMGLEENNSEKFNNNIIKTQRIIMEFMTTLDMEVGGEMAQNLFQLYEYLHYRLIQANLKKDATMIDEVLGHLKLLKETWEEAIGIARREDAQLMKAGEEGHVYSA
jgi:flagellar secretion chaperone FliS